MTTTSSPVLYEHRQTGWVMLALAVVPLFALLAFVRMPQADRPLSWLLLGPGVVFVVALLGFSSLAVTVSRDALVARFGIGVIRKRVALADIVAVDVVRTRWYQGWGIHFTRDGLLWNVAGLDAIRLELTSGRRLTIGSDDAPRLAASLRRAIDDRQRGR